AVLWIGFMSNLAVEHEVEIAKEVVHHKQLNIAIPSSGYGRLQFLPNEGELGACTHLNLPDNRLEQLPSGVLLFTRLQKLNLKANQLNSLPPDFAALRSLNEVWLDKNQFTAFPVAVSTATQLQRLWLDDNQISGIEDCKMISLQRLSLARNQLSSLG